MINETLIGSALEQERNFILTVLNTIDALVLVLDRDGRIVRFNRACEEATGYSFDEIRGRYVWDILLTPDEVEPVKSVFANVKAGMFPSRFENAWVTKDGRKLVISWSNSALLDKDSRVEYVVATGIDITERKHAESALKAAMTEAEDARAWSDGIIAAIGDGISIQDKDFRILYQNEIHRQLTGDHKGQYCHQAYAKQTGRCEGCPVALAFEDGGIHRVEQCTPTDKGPLWVEITASPLLDASGRIIAGIEVVRDITERKRTDEDLFQAKRDWEDTFNTITDLVTLHDRNFNIIRANKAAEQMLGIPLLPEKAKCYRHYHGTDGPARNCASCKSLVTGTPTIEEVFEPHLNKFLEIRAMPRLDSEGNLIGLIHIVRDISGRKLMEESLQEQKIFAEQLVQNSAVATFVLNPDHKVVLWNKACEELTGIPSAEMASTDNHWKPFYNYSRETLADLVINGDTQSVSGLYGKFSRSTLVPNGLRAEGWYQNLNGKERYILFDAVPIYDSKGKLIVAIETLHDITELRRAEENLAASESQLRTIIETMPEALTLLDADGAILEINPSGMALLEAETIDQVVGKSMQSSVTPEYRQAFKDLIEKTFKGETDRLEFEIVAFTGTRKWVETHTAPFRNGRSDITALLGLTRDITERKKLEEQLFQSQKMEAIGQLAGGIAHDFNNILSAIIGYGSILQMKIADTDPVRSNVDQILVSADRAANLTKSLLAFSRKQVMNPGPISLNTIVKKAQAFIGRIIGEDIELRTRLAEERTTVMADIGQIEQVLMNLAANGRDVMPAGGLLSIETGIVELDEQFVLKYAYGKAGTYVQLSVSDTGDGMDRQAMEHLFEPFFTTKEVGKGTGLGLSIVYGIIKQHKGFIHVYSERGMGATFKIYLPLLQTETDLKQEVAQLPLMTGGTETILIAEDDETVRTFTAQILRSFGYNVIEAVDGEDALKKFDEHKDAVQLLIFDVIMPKKNGKDVCGEIKKIRADIPVFFVSGYPADIMHQKGMLDEDVDFVWKPVAPHQLLGKVREILDRQKAGRNKEEREK